jgi:predicted transcriptional regulator
MKRARKRDPALEAMLQKFGSQLVEFRKSIGVTQKSLGEASGIAAPHLVGIEKGQIDCSFTSLMRLLLALADKNHEYNKCQEQRKKVRKRSRKVLPEEKLPDQEGLAEQGG